MRYTGSLMVGPLPKTEDIALQGVSDDHRTPYSGGGDDSHVRPASKDGCSIIENSRRSKCVLGLVDEDWTWQCLDRLHVLGIAQSTLLAPG